jgi:hypothetical protein
VAVIRSAGRHPINSHWYESRFHSPDRLNGTSVSLHLQVADAELVWKQALNAGALPIIPLAEQFWGERLKDPFGHEWTIAQLLQILGSTEVENAAAAVASPRICRPYTYKVKQTPEEAFCRVEASPRSFLRGRISALYP